MFRFLLHQCHKTSQEYSLSNRSISLSINYKFKTKLQKRAENYPKYDHDDFKMFYKFKSGNLAAFLSRLKILQTTISVVSIPLLYNGWQLNEISTPIFGFIVTMTLLAPAALMWYSYHTRRLIVYMWLNQKKETIKIAHVTFWGSRRDVIVPLSSIPILYSENIDKYLIKLQLQGAYSNMFFFFTLYNTLCDEQILNKVLGKHLLSELRKKTIK